MKPSDESHRAATKVNAISSVMGYVAKADSFEKLEGSTKSSVTASLMSLRRGRRQWHGDEWKTHGTWEGLNVLAYKTLYFKGSVYKHPWLRWFCSLTRNSAKKQRTTAGKIVPIRRGEVRSMALRQSDTPIVVEKQGNACGAKGCALLRKSYARITRSSNRSGDVK